MDITADWIERSWPLTAVRVGERFGESNAFAVNAHEGDFVLKIAGEWSARSDVDRATGIPAYLRAHGLACAPSIVHARTGAECCACGQRLAYLMERVPGATLPATPAGYRRLGEPAAALHALTDYPGACPLSAEALRPDMLAAAARYPFVDEYRALIESLPPLEPDGLPIGLIHPDLHPDHAIVRPDGTLVLVDWDECGTGPRVLDVGQPLISTFLTEDLTFQRGEAEAFYSAYSSHITLTPEERALIFPAALFYALWYLPFGPSAPARWRRIQDALRRRDELLAVLPGA